MTEEDFDNFKAAIRNLMGHWGLSFNADDVGWSVHVEEAGEREVEDFIDRLEYSGELEPPERPKGGV